MDQDAPGEGVGRKKCKLNNSVQITSCLFPCISSLMLEIRQSTARALFKVDLQQMKGASLSSSHARKSRCLQVLHLYETSGRVACPALIRGSPKTEYIWFFIYIRQMQNMIDIYNMATSGSTRH